MRSCVSSTERVKEAVRATAMGPLGVPINIGNNEHAKSEANGTFQWIPDDQLEGLRKRGISILRHVWVFKMKRDDNGHYSIYKARGCVDGSQQKQGFDYNETFAPTCREASFKALMSLSVAMD